MDPMSCVAIAGAVVQFLDFGTRFTREAYSLYEDGESVIRQKAVIQTNDLKDFIAKFDKTLQKEAQEQKSSEDEEALRSLCLECKKLADTLSAKLETLNVQEKNRVWKSLGTALSNVWSKKDILKTEEDLQKYRQAIDTRMLSITRNAVTAMASQQSAKFNSLDQETKQIIGGLTELKSSIEADQKLQRSALAQILNRQEVVVQLKSTRTVIDIHDTKPSTDLMKDQAIIQACNESKSEETLLRKTTSSTIIDSLCFSSITQRLDEVTEAHYDTFQWVFQHPHEDVQGRQWDDFVVWLESGDGLYWINGKAGSGKSTLLKLVASHPMTKKHLEAWKGDYELFTASFFFWSSGTMLQRSQEGMLRSLLYDILSRLPQLTPCLFPVQWAEMYLQRVGNPDSKPRCSLNLSNLMGAFEKLLQQNKIPMRLCLFVDGLDEYSGLDSQIAQLFQRTAKAPQVKVCVSSRPHLVFKESFQEQPQLRLEDLTKGDIRKYVFDTLENNELMQRRICREQEQMRELVDEIVQSASGVFIWVKLVVKELLRGLENHDHISHLQKRLRLLPTDLEELYEHMVFAVDRVYRIEASRFYQIIGATSEQDDDWSPALPLTIFQLYLAEASEVDVDLVYNAKPGFFSQKTILSGIGDTDLRLRSRCGGLLETQFGKSSLKEIQPEMPVTYIHRTVRDYLDGTGIRHVLSDRTGGLSAGSFNPNIALMRAYLLRLKTTETVFNNRATAEGLIETFITHARRGESDLCDSDSRLLDEFFYFSTKWLLTVFSDAHQGRERVTEILGKDPATFAIKFGLRYYLQTQLSEYLVKVDREMLSRAMCPSARRHDFVKTEIINLLLEFGADPNERPPGISAKRADNQSPWQSAITYLAIKFKIVPEHQREPLLMRWSGILMLLVQSGAKVNTICAGPMGSSRDEKTGEISVKETTVSPKGVVLNLYKAHRKELAILVKLFDSKGANDPVDDEIGRDMETRHLRKEAEGKILKQVGSDGDIPHLIASGNLDQKVDKESVEMKRKEVNSEDSGTSSSRMFGRMRRLVTGKKTKGK